MSLSTGEQTCQGLPGGRGAGRAEAGQHQPVTHDGEPVTARDRVARTGDVGIGELDDQAARAAHEVVVIAATRRRLEPKRTSPEAMALDEAKLLEQPDVPVDGRERERGLDSARQLENLVDRQVFRRADEHVGDDLALSARVRAVFAIVR